MTKILLRKQLAEIFRTYLYDAKKNKARSKGTVIAYFVLFGTDVYKRQLHGMHYPLPGRGDRIRQKEPWQAALPLPGKAVNILRKSPPPMPMHGPAGLSLSKKYFWQALKRDPLRWALV